MADLIEIRPGRRIRIEIHNSHPKDATLFFIHGLGGRGAQWREQIAFFKGRYNLIVPDLLGQGDSEKPRNLPGKPYGFSALLDDLDQLFLRYAGLHNGVLGHSYGGALAAALALRQASRIQKLALLCPVSIEPFKGVPWVYSLPLFLLERLRAPLDRYFESLATRADDDPRMLQFEREGRAKNDLFVIKALLQGLGEIPRLKMAELKIPTLIIAGADDGVIPPARVKAFYTQLPTQDYHVLAEAAHLVHLEKSAEVNALLDTFMKFSP